MARSSKVEEKGGAVIAGSLPVEEREGVGGNWWLFISREVSCWAESR